MTAVEIAEAISQLAEQPFDAAEFPYAFLLAFGNKETTSKRLRAGSSNKSDLGGVLQTSNIHIKTCCQPMGLTAGACSSRQYAQTPSDAPEGGQTPAYSAGTAAGSSTSMIGCGRWISISFGQTCRKLAFSASQS